MSLCLAPVLLADRYNIKRHTHLESDPTTDRGEGAGNKPTLHSRQASKPPSAGREEWRIQHRTLLGTGRCGGCRRACRGDAQTSDVIGCKYGLEKGTLEYNNVRPYRRSGLNSLISRFAERSISLRPQQ